MENDCANSSTSSDGSNSSLPDTTISVQNSSLKARHQSVASLELPNSSSSSASFSTEDEYSDQKFKRAFNTEMTRSNKRTSLLAFNNKPSCSKTSIVMEKRPNLQRIGEKLKKFITQRDQKHSAQFRKLFADSLAPDEQLSSSFSCLYFDCANRLIPGRLFASFGHLAFNSNNFCTRFILSFGNVDGVERTSQKFVDMSGGIQIMLDNGIVCTFGSFSSPDKVYTLLARLWKSNDHISQEQFALPKFPSQNSLLKMGGTNTDGSQVLPTPTDTASQTTEDTKSCEPAHCECIEHRGQLMLASIYPMSTHQLFSFLFNQNKLMNEFLVSTKRTEVNCATWTEIDGKHKRKRTVTYTVELTNSWGPKSSDVTEQQELIEIGNKASDGYLIKKEASNSGVPYADSFNIYCTYCITRISSKSCRMKVYAGVEFKKSVMGMFKGFIERSALGGITEYYKNLDKFLTSNTDQIMEESRLKAGPKFGFESPSRGSFRSMDGYDSDVDEHGRQEATKQRLVKRLSCITAKPNVVTAVAQPLQIDHSVLSGINQSLRLITLILLFLLLIQMWSTFFPANSTQESGLTSTELLSRLILHAQNADSLEDVQKILMDIERRLLSN